MTGEQLLEGGVARAARATLAHLCRQIVRTEARVMLFRRSALFDRAEVMEEYLERLRIWHFYWVRGTEARLERCSNCGYVQAPSPETCPACSTPWVMRV